MRPASLALGLALLLSALSRAGETAPPGGGKPPPRPPEDKPPPPPIVLSECRPRIDVRRLLRVEYEGRPLGSSRDLEDLPSVHHRGPAYGLLWGLCERRGSAIQEIAKFFRAPVTVTLPRECEEPSFFRLRDRRIFLGSFRPCAGDTFAALYHELGHVLVHDSVLRDLDVWEAITLCAGEGHDYTIFDPEDETVLLVMDARTNLLQALDEGIANGISLALAGRGGRIGRLERRLTVETRSQAWRRLPWSRKQANEHFIGAVVSRFLGPDRRRALQRLDLIVRAGRRSPRSFQQFLEALADVDPVESRGRIDRILQDLNAGWDSEREEVLRLRRQGR